MLSVVVERVGGCVGISKTASSCGMLPWRTTYGRSGERDEEWDKEWDEEGEKGENTVGIGVH